jgi:3-hydroxyisobutyrate dehydrogenase-like beta-hydroxyacid dehydrogenase
MCHMKNVQEEVSVIGLGAMGSALARALIRDGYRITVWNRTSAKAEPLVRDGAVLASSAAAAVGASPIVVVCVADYKVAHSILEMQGVAPALAGRVLVQLSTGNPQEARDSEAWARERGTDYLDGAIMAIPSQIGTPDAAIFASGAASAFQRSAPLLKSFAGNLRYVGEPVGAASALDYATLSYVFGGLLGAVHGALICESEGLRVDAFGALLADLAPVIGGMVKHMSTVIHAGMYEGPQASLSICARGFEGIVQQAREARINSEFPTFALGLLRRAIAAGHGEEDFGALIKVLRGSPDGDVP